MSATVVLDGTAENVARKRRRAAGRATRGAGQQVGSRQRQERTRISKAGRLGSAATSVRVGDAPEPVDSPTLGQLLHAARTRRGMTLAELGEAVGAGTSYIHKMEKDRANKPPPAQLGRLADVLETPLASLYRAAGYPVPKSLTEPGLQACADRLGAAARGLRERLEALTIELEAVEEELKAVQRESFGRERGR